MKRSILPILAITSALLFAGCTEDEAAIKEPSPIEQVKDNDKDEKAAAEAEQERKAAEEKATEDAKKAEEKAEAERKEAEDKAAKAAKKAEEKAEKARKEAEEKAAKAEAKKKAEEEAKAAEAHAEKMQARKRQIDIFNGYADQFARELMKFDYSEHRIEMLAIDIDNMRFVTDQETGDPELDAAYDVVREGLEEMTAGLIAVDDAQIEAGGERFIEGKELVNALPTE